MVHLMNRELRNLSARCFVAVAIVLAAAAATKADEPPLTVTVTELGTDKPIAGATVVVMSSPYDKVRSDTDADGIAHLVPKALTYMVVQMKDYAPVARSIGTGEAAAEKQSLHVVMEHGVRISGSVVDQDDKPVAGATILWSASKTYPDGHEMLDTLQRTATTGADGKWSYDHLPEDVTNVSIGAYHPAFLPADPAVVLEPVPDLASLHDGSWKSTLTRGIPIDITVHGPDGKPVPKARIIYGPRLVSIAVRPIIETDADGHVQLGVPSGTEAIITVTSKGLAPELQRIKVGTDATSAAFDLKPAATITGHVVDTNGNGVGGAVVYIKSWRDAHTINVTNGIRTESDGAFKWTAAPTDEVQLTASAHHYDAAPPVSGKPGDDVKIVLPGGPGL